MLALTIRQPFAWGICAGIKTIEWRSRQTTHRGLFAIHAALDEMPWSSEANLVIEHLTNADATWSGEGAESISCRGAIIGLAELVGCDNIGQARLWSELSRRDDAANTNPDPRGWPIAWLLQNARFLPTPIPCRGKLGLWEVPSDILRQITFPVAP